MLQSKGSQIGTEQQKCSFREISADQWGKGPDGARNVSSWPPDGARHPQSARAASVRPSTGRAPEEMCVCVCVSPRTERPATLLHFRKLIGRGACAERTWSSCPVPRGDTSAAFPLVCRISEPPFPFVLRTGARRGEDFASILKPAILLEKNREKNIPRLFMRAGHHVAGVKTNSAKTLLLWYCQLTQWGERF